MDNKTRALQIWNIHCQFFICIYCACLLTKTMTWQHNQQVKVSIFGSATDLNTALQPMLTFMAKYGFPEDFPQDGSPFSQKTCKLVNLTDSQHRMVELTEYW